MLKIKTTSLFAAALALIVGYALQTPANAMTSTSLQAYDTTMTQSLPFDDPGASLGTLKVSVHDGFVSGYYLPQDGQPETVAGGVTGDSIWFDIGNDLVVTGQLKDGRIVGTAAPRDGASLERYKFTAAPEKTP